MPSGHGNGGEDVPLSPLLAGRGRSRRGDLRDDDQAGEEIHLDAGQWFRAIDVVRLTRTSRRSSVCHRSRPSRPAPSSSGQKAVSPAIHQVSERPSAADHRRLVYRRSTRTGRTQTYSVYAAGLHGRSSQHTTDWPDAGVHGRTIAAGFLNRVRKFDSCRGHQGSACSGWILHSGRRRGRRIVSQVCPKPPA
jgi:hypothetical protein